MEEMTTDEDRAGQAPSNVRVSVVVPAYNASGTIDACLSSLLAQSVADDGYEIIVVDNGSTDATAERIRRYPVVYVHEPEGGVYDARNAGVSASTGRIIAFTDSDCVADEKWLASGLQYLKQFDIVAGCIDPLPSAHKLLYAYDRYVHWKPVEQRSVNIAAGNAFMHRAVFERLGGFVKGLTTAGDSVFSTRARQEGYTIGYAPAAVVYHPVDGWARRLRGMMREGYGSGIKALYRKGRRTNRLRNAWMLLHHDWDSIRGAWARREVDAWAALGVMGIAWFLRVFEYGSIATARAFGGFNRAFARR